MDLRFFGGIRDSIHGLILFTKLESDIINTMHMDRLRYIKNSAFAYRIYPSHTTTRFTHSLGVMFLAYQMGRITLQRYIRLTKKKEAWEDEISTEYKPSEVLEILRLTGLLHDIGHGPFSHSIEPIMHETLQKTEKSALQEMEKLGIDAVHEYYSYKIITGKTEIRELIESNGINPLDVGVLLTKINSSEHKGYLNAKGIQLLKPIISSQIDADRLDNLLRDSNGVGVPYGLIDIDNIINNIYINRDEHGLNIVYHIRALDSIEHMLDSRYKMYRWIYLHRINVLYDAILLKVVKKLIEESILEAKIFLWNNLSRDWGDYTDDSTILKAIAMAYKKGKTKCWLASSFFKQDNLPIPIWRNFEDLLSLLDLGVNDGAKLIDKITDNFKENIEEFSNILEEKINDELNEDIKILIGLKEAPPAYKWREEGIKLRIDKNKVADIFEVSFYVKRLYDMGKVYRPFYVYFFKEGKDRSAYSKLYSKVRQLVKKSLTDLFKNEEKDY